MPAFLPEPPYRHDQPSRIGILLINLGTPEAPTAAGLRPYLAEFLSDRRVVEIPPAVWKPILHGVILRTRPARSAEKYASVWGVEGSPLKVHTERQTALLQQELAGRTPVPLVVEYAMRYGRPAVREALGKLRQQGCDRILVLPLYPQYAASSSGTALDAVWRVLLATRNVPDVRTIRHFHDHPGYLDALRQSVDSYWAEHGHPDKLVMSFHGIPKRSLDLGDPYHCECQKTGRLLAEALGLSKDRYRICFQSRFGKAEWLKPYTARTLEELGRAGTRRVDVICPGFVADCLETLEEIGMEGKAEFLKAGGGEYHYISALNSRATWISALADLVMENLRGWLPEDWNPIEEHGVCDARLQQARALGAEN